MSVLRVVGAVAFLCLAACGPEAQTQQEAPAASGAGEKTAFNAPACTPDECGPGGGGGSQLSTANIDTRYTGGWYGTPSSSFRPTDVPMYPLSPNRPDEKCRQQSFVQMHFPNPLYGNSTVFFAGVVAPSTKVNFHIYDGGGNLVKTHQTNFSNRNCVITQEYEYANLGNLAPGAYDVYASFWYIGAGYSGGWYTDGGFGPLAYANWFVGSITVQ